MKTVIIIVFSIALWTFSANAQLQTNIAIRATVTITNPGVSTNSSNSTFNIDPLTSQKDDSRLKGLSWAYFNARATGVTNSLEVWVAKTWAKDYSDVTGTAYLDSISSDTLRKLTILINSGGLSPSDLSTVTTIANKSPVP